MREISLNLKFTLYVAAFMAITLIAAFAFPFFSFVGTLQENKTEALSSAVEQISLTVDENFLSIDSMMLSIGTTDIMHDFILSSQPLHITDFTKINQLTEDIRSDLLFDQAWNAGYVDSIYLVLDDVPVQVASRSIWHQEEIQAVREIYQAADPRDFAKYILHTNDGVTTLYVMQVFYNSSFQESVTVIYALNMQQLSRTLFAMSEGTQADVIYEDQILLSNVTENIGLVAQPDVVAQTQSEDFFQYQPLEHTPLSISTYIPRSVAYDSVYDTAKRIALIIIVVIAVICVMTAITINHFTRFLHDLEENISDIRNKQYGIRLPSYPFTELNNISSLVNQMSGEINVLINKNYKSQLLLKDADIHLLQSQIAPHFLINTLTTIGTKAMLKGDPDTYQMTSHLCKMMEASLYNTTDTSSFVSVRNELEYITCYLALQNMRFPDIVQYDIYIERDKIEDFYIPRLSLEPFVENAVVHGLRNLTANGRLELSLTCTADKLVCKIKDNGGTYTKNIENKNIQHGIGVENVKKRCALLFDDDFLIEYRCQPDVQTVVTCVFPILTENPDTTGGQDESTSDISGR